MGMDGNGLEWKGMGGENGWEWVGIGGNGWEWVVGMGGNGWEWVYRRSPGLYQSGPAYPAPPWSKVMPKMMLMHAEMHGPVMGGGNGWEWKGKVGNMWEWVVMGGDGW